jgi:rubrerythrin
MPDTPALADALRAVINMERSLAGYHMNSIGVFSDPELQKLFEAMMAADKQHAQTLLDVLDRLAPPATIH